MPRTARTWASWCLGLADRLDEITGIGAVNARVLIAELGTDPSQFATPGHAAAWAKLTSRMMQSGESSWNGRPPGKGNRYLRGALGQAVMSAAKTDTRLGAMYRRIARKRGKQKAIVAVGRVICEIAWILICDPGARYIELGPDYYQRPQRQTATRSARSRKTTPARRSSSSTTPPGTRRAGTRRLITARIPRLPVTSMDGAIA